MIEFLQTKIESIENEAWAIAKRHYGIERTEESATKITEAIRRMLYRQTNTVGDESQLGNLHADEKNAHIDDGLAAVFMSIGVSRREIGINNAEVVNLLIVAAQGLVMIEQAENTKRMIDGWFGDRASALDQHIPR